MRDRLALPISVEIGSRVGQRQFRVQGNIILVGPYFGTLAQCARIGAILAPMR